MVRFGRGKKEPVVNGEKRDRKPLDWQVGRKPEPYDPKTDQNRGNEGKERAGKMGFGDSVRQMFE